MSLVLGLTGSIGMGKSATAGLFRAEGVPVHDADACVHALYAPGGAAVFGNDAAMKALEAIVHPAVAEERAAFLATHADAPVVVFDVPLLFETGGEGRVDLVVVVSASPSVQRARVLARAGMTEAKFAAILARQTPDADKRARADLVIPTGGGLDETRAAVAEAIARARALACKGVGEGR